MSRSPCTDIPPMRAPRCCRPCRSLRRVRGGSGAFSSIRARSQNTLSGPISESTLGRAFDNALGRLEPRFKPIRSGFIPVLWHRSKASLLPLTLEAKPSIAVLSGDRDISSERALATFRRLTPLSEPRALLGTAGCDSPVDSAPFCRRGSHEPHLPPLSCLVEKGSITHRRVLRRCSAPTSGLTN